MKIGMRSEDVLNPYTKEPIRHNDFVRCQKISSAGIVLCEKKQNSLDHIKKIIFSLVILIFVGLLFSFNIVVSVDNIENSYEALFTSIPSFIIVFGTMIFGYTIAKAYQSNPYRQ